MIVSVSSGSGSIPPGSYLATFEKVEPVESPEYGQKFRWWFSVASGKYKGHGASVHSLGVALRLLVRQVSFVLVCRVRRWNRGKETCRHISAKRI